MKDELLTKPRFVLAVNELEKSVDFYVKCLGFKIESRYTGWTFLIRDDVYIMLGECPDEKPASEIGNHS